MRERPPRRVDRLRLPQMRLRQRRMAHIKIQRERRQAKGMLRDLRPRLQHLRRDKLHPLLAQLAERLEVVGPRLNNKSGSNERKRRGRLSFALACRPYRTSRVRASDRRRFPRHFLTRTLAQKWLR